MDRMTDELKAEIEKIRKDWGPYDATRHSFCGGSVEILLKEIDALTQKVRSAEEQLQKMTTAHGLLNPQGLAQGDELQAEIKKVATLEAELQKKDAKIEIMWKYLNDYVSHKVLWQMADEIQKDAPDPAPKKPHVLNQDSDSPIYDDGELVIEKPDDKSIFDVIDNPDTEYIIKTAKCSECAGLGLPPVFPGSERRRCNTCGSTGKKPDE